MKISDVRAVPVAVPFDQFGTWQPVTMWYGTRTASRHALVFVDTDEGIPTIHPWHLVTVGCVNARFNQGPRLQEWVFYR